MLRRERLFNSRPRRGVTTKERTDQARRSRWATGATYAMVSATALLDAATA